MPNKITTKYKGILLDLDGTLVDTAPDMAAALNYVLVLHKLPTLAFSTIRPWVSHGGIALINLGFPNATTEQKEHLRQEFLSHYQNNIAKHSRLFDGITDVLQWVKDENLQWGIVTNKPSWLAKPLLKLLEFPLPYSTLICGDTLAKNKPHPLPLLTACKQMNLTVKDCIYIGDAQRDIEAANNAQMDSIVANYGYIEESDNVEKWGAGAIIETPLECLAFFKRG